MKNKQLDCYLQELVDANLYNTNPQYYLYLRKLAHHLASDVTFLSYIRFLKIHNKNKLHFDAVNSLPYESELRKSIKNIDHARHLIKLKGQRWFLDQCFSEKTPVTY